MQPWHQHALNRYRQSEKRLENNSRRGADQRQIRASNRLLILNYIREHKILPRADLTRYTGLSRTAIGNIIDDLIQEGMVQEDEHRVGADRRTISLSFNATAGYVLGGSLGRNHLTILLSDLVGTPIQRSDLPFSTVEGSTKGVPRLIQAINTFITQQQIEREKLLGIGLGIVGTLDPSLQRTTVPTPFAGWAGVHLQKALEDTLGIPVYLDNDGNMGASGESHYGSGRNERNMLYVKVGSGIAGGLILNHQIYRGSIGTAGEIGHIPVDFNGTLCHCGHYGCLETVAGTRGILTEAQRLFPTVTTISQVIEAARYGEPAALHALERAGKYLGFALSSLVNTLNPALIVLDGSTMQAKDLVLRPLLSSLEAHSLQVPFSHTRVVLAERSGLAIPLGGIATVLDTVFGSRFA